MKNKTILIKCSTEFFKRLEHLSKCLGISKSKIMRNAFDAYELEYETRFVRCVECREPMLDDNSLTVDGMGLFRCEMCGTDQKVFVNNGIVIKQSK